MKWVAGQENQIDFLDEPRTGWGDPPGGPATQTTPRDRPATSDREFMDTFCGVYATSPRQNSSDLSRDAVASAEPRIY